MFGKPNHIVPYCVQPKNNNNKSNLSAKRGGYNKSSFALNMGEASFSSARLPIDDDYIMQSYKYWRCHMPTYGYYITRKEIRSTFSILRNGKIVQLGTISIMHKPQTVQESSSLLRNL